MSDDQGQSHSLGLWDATALVAGSMIGSGIFLVSASVARNTGSPGWLLAVWLAAGALTVAAALSYGELAAMFPHAGGQYVYLREAFGPLPAFLFGWTQLLVIQTGTLAAVAVGFARFLGVLLPGLDDRSLAGPITPQRLTAIALLTLLTWVNTRGLAFGKLVQNAFTLAKVGVLLAVIAVGAYGYSHATAGATSAAALLAPPFLGPFPYATFGPAMVGALFASDAWNNVTFTAGEVRDPSRNLPRSLLLGTGITIALYLVVNLAYLALPFGAIAGAPSDRVASRLMELVPGGWATSLVAFGIMISTFGCANGIVLAGARVNYALARDGLFFRQSGELNAAKVPGHALWMQLLWSAVLCLSGTYSQLLDYVIFAVLLFYVATIAGLFRLRRTRPDAPRPYRALGYPLLPAAYLVAAALVAVSLLLAPETRLQSLAGLACVAAGVPVFLYLRRAAT